METKRENHQKGKNKSLRDSTIPTNRYMIKNRSIQINFSRNPNNLCYTFRFINLSLTSQTRNIYYVFLMDCSGVTLSAHAFLFSRCGSHARMAYTAHALVYLQFIKITHAAYLHFNKTRSPGSTTRRNVICCDDLLQLQQET